MEYWSGWSDGMLGSHGIIPVFRDSNTPWSQKIYRRMLTLIIKPMANIMVAKADPP